MTLEKSVFYYFITIDISNHYTSYPVSHINFRSTYNFTGINMGTGDTTSFHNPANTTWDRAQLAGLSSMPKAWV